MTFKLKAGLASAALLVAAGSAGSVSAADLGGYPRGGSIKDGGYMAPAPDYAPASSGP